MTPPRLLHLCWEEQVKTEEGKYFEMLPYTSSAGRPGMLVFARVKNAIFSLKTQRKQMGV